MSHNTSVEATGAEAQTTISDDKSGARFKAGEMVIYLPMGRMAVVREQQQDQRGSVRIAYANMNLGLMCRWVASAQLEHMQKMGSGG